MKIDKTQFVMFENKLPENEIPLISFAFYGDAMHTFLVRNYLLSKGIISTNNLHKLASKLCSAKNQADTLEFLTEFLTDEEKEIVRRARNAKTHKPPQNCELEVYKKATAYEVLFGVWAYRKNFDRIMEIFEKGLEINKEIKC